MSIHKTKKIAKNNMKIDCFWEVKKMQDWRRTDLAIEVRESFPEDRIEVDGVILAKRKYAEDITVTRMEIVTKEGANKMNKPIGNYVTIEFTNEKKGIEEQREKLIACIIAQLEFIISSIKEKDCLSVNTFLFSGLGNRYATPDALGPYVLEQMNLTRQSGVSNRNKEKTKAISCGIVPGVLAQTGMESKEILHGIIKEIHPEILIVIDSLATQSVNRLCRTIQITDTGISPGAGIGNNRQKITKETMGIPVLAIGVPTVVDAGTIIYEAFDTLRQKGIYTEKELEHVFHSSLDERMKSLFVTPKDID